jgi:hypothetical protein
MNASTSFRGWQAQIHCLGVEEGQNGFVAR